MVLEITLLKVDLLIMMMGEIIHELELIKKNLIKVRQVKKLDILIIKLIVLINPILK